MLCISNQMEQNKAIIIAQIKDLKENETKEKKELFKQLVFNYFDIYKENNQYCYYHPEIGETWSYETFELFLMDLFGFDYESEWQDFINWTTLENKNTFELSEI